MSDFDTGYYRARAATHRSLATDDAHENVAEIHKELASQYDALSAALAQEV